MQASWPAGRIAIPFVNISLACKALVDLSQKDPGVRGEDVFVKIIRTPPANFSFASGVSAPEFVAAEAGARDGAMRGFTRPELIDAVTELFQANDRTRIAPMLPGTFVLKIRETLPYGGLIRGPEAFGIPPGD
jgi:hypothetical protein